MNTQGRLNHTLPEVRERNARIRAEVRKGKTATEIADACGVPVKMVEQMLAPIDARLSDPAHLLRHAAIGAGCPPADVQVYWVGFLTAAGRICGQGASSALVVTLGHRPQEYMHALMADLATPQVRHELCRSSLLGWQLYVRDRSLCEVLLRWGVYSEVYGDDPAVLADLPREFIAPFLRGYLDGNWTTPGSVRSRPHGLVLYGAEGVLSAIDAMIHRNWRIAPGVVTHRPPRAELRYSPRDEREVLDHVHTYTTRGRGQSKPYPA